MAIKTSEHKGYTIGEVSRITGIKIETLRFYDREGIISPEYVDPSNNYRYYSDSQFWSFDIIQCFRRLGVSLDKIKEVFSMSDNAEVIQLMLQQKETAIENRDFYAKVVEDIEWYTQQYDQVNELYCGNSIHTEVSVKHLPERRVIMADNSDKAGSYHRRLQELCKRAGIPSNRLQRHYGFMLDGNQLCDCHFVKTAEYLSFEDAILAQIPEEYITIIPEGDYACYTHLVYNDKTDFTALNEWLQKEKLTSDYVISDELGLRMFIYLDNGYTCETKVLLK